MQRDDNVYLAHMLDMARKAAAKVEMKSGSEPIGLTVYIY